MKLMGLDRDLKPLGCLPYLNLQWRRRYWEPGSYSVQMLAADYAPEVKYVRLEGGGEDGAGRPETGMVQQTKLTRDPAGDYVQISGSFLEAAFNRVYAYPHITGEYTMRGLANHILRHRHDWYRLDLLNIAPAEGLDDTEKIPVDWRDEPLGECLCNTLKGLEMGHRLNYNPMAGAFVWEPWQGKNRTKGQTENAPVTFGDESPHVTRFAFTEDESGYRNHAVVFYGRDSAGDPYRHDVWTEGGMAEGRRWILMNVDAGLTEAQRTAMAHAELLKYPIALSAEAEVTQDGLKYLLDYDLGDLCDVECALLGKAFSARITGVDEVWKANRHMVTLTIGEPLCTDGQRLKRIARSDVRARRVPREK